MPELTPEQKARMNSSATDTATKPETKAKRSRKPSKADADAVTALAKKGGSTIREVVSEGNQALDTLQEQRDLVTDHLSDRAFEILDPQSIQAEFAAKTLEKLEGKSFIPFELEPLELPLVQRYVPQLPQSYVSPPSNCDPSKSLPEIVTIETSLSNVQPNSTNGGGNLETGRGKDFA